MAGQGGETRARILDAALALFNREGYAALSAVDIAGDLGISPGHLYYHFRGKGELAATLLEAHVAELGAIRDAALRALEGPDADVATLWTHVHIVVEEVHDARFAWSEAGALARSDQRLATQLRAAGRVLDLFAHAALDRLAATGAVRAPREVLDGMAAQMALGMALQGAWLQLALPPDAMTPRALVERAAALVMLPLTALVPAHRS